MVPQMDSPTAGVCTLHPDRHTRKAEKLRSLFLLTRSYYEMIYGPDTRNEIARPCSVAALLEPADFFRQDPEALRETDLLFTGWTSPVLDARLLDRLPRLRAVFHAAGSIRPIITDAFWEREIVISSAREANAIPVAEYTMSVVVLSLKHFWKLSRQAKNGSPWRSENPLQVPGCYRSTVGLVSYGTTARRVSALLRSCELRQLVYCPLLSRTEAAREKVELVTLERLFTESDVVSIHAPLLPETRGFITGAHIASMKEGATLINTSRGPVIRQEELIEVLEKRPDLTAVLDVADPEPPERDSPLLRLPNVVLSPHIAGSVHSECRRMGAYMLEEFRRYLAGKPLRWQITRKMHPYMA